MCNTCHSTVGPFYLIDKGLGIKACGPLKFAKDSGKLIGRAEECLERRRKLEIEWYGPERENNPFAR